MAINGHGGRLVLIAIKGGLIRGETVGIESQGVKEGFTAH
jgi:hypothetical protein